MNVLIACEESQVIANEFRKIGHYAFSCDLQNCSGNHPEYHIKENCLRILNGGKFITEDNKLHYIRKWDLIIAHPPCTYLSKVANKYHSLSYIDLEYINIRTSKRLTAAEFFMSIVNANCKRIAIENPIGIMNTLYRKPDQIINPYQFAESENDFDNYVTKSTCLWLKGLPLLKTNNLSAPDNAKIFGINNNNGKSYCWEEKVTGSNRQKLRSKTFPGIAKAMALQWGYYEY